MFEAAVLLRLPLKKKSLYLSETDLMGKIIRKELKSMSTYYKQQVTRLKSGLTRQVWLLSLTGKKKTYLWSPPGTRRCSLPPGCGTARCYCTVPSSRGPPRSRSSRLWSPVGSGSAGHWWGEWAGTTLCWKQWRAASCQTSALRRTSCSSHRAPAGRCCHRTATPGEKRRGCYWYFQFHRCQKYSHSPLKYKLESKWLFLSILKQ